MEKDFRILSIFVWKNSFVKYRFKKLTLLYLLAKTLLKYFHTHHNKLQVVFMDNCNLF